MISDSEIPKCPEFEVKSKIGKLIMNEKILEEYSVKVYEIDPYFYEHHKDKIKVDKNECEYWIFFSSRNWWTKPRCRELIFEKKRQETLEKKLDCKFIRINTSSAERGYDTDYEVSKVQIFISKFKHKKIKKKKTK